MFYDHNVNGTVLLNISTKELALIGIARLGARKMLMKEIVVLKGTLGMEYNETAPLTR